MDYADQLAATHRDLYFGGGWHAPQADRYTTTHSPGSGAALGRVAVADTSDVDRAVVRYDSAFALMQDLRRMGATNILMERRRTPTRRATMLRMAQVYGERFADSDGRIRATFDVIWLSGWAPHPSQQKPLPPGSAKASLAEAVRKLKLD